MKKLLHVLTLLIIVSAAILCLSTDNNGAFFTSKENVAGVLYQTTQDHQHKPVIELCPDGESYYTTCVTGSGSCYYVTCPPTTEEVQ